MIHRIRRRAVERTLIEFRLGLSEVEGMACVNRRGTRSDGQHEHRFAAFLSLGERGGLLFSTAMCTYMKESSCEGMSTAVQDVRNLSFPLALTSARSTYWHLCNPVHDRSSLVLFIVQQNLMAATFPEQQARSCRAQALEPKYPPRNAHHTPLKPETIQSAPDDRPQSSTSTAHTLSNTVHCT